VKKYSFFLNVKGGKGFEEREGNFFKRFRETIEP